MTEQSVIGRRYGTRPPQPEPTVEPIEVDPTEVAASASRRRLTIFGAGLAAAGVLISGLSGLLAVDPNAVSVEEQVAITAFEARTSDATTRLETLPDHATAGRSLSMALTAAASVAEAQNSARSIVSQGALVDGTLSPARLEVTSRSLMPHFASGTEQADLRPWYLLAADAGVVNRTGIPDFFVSGVEWVAQTPSAINDDGSVPVTWLALHPSADGASHLLAWAQADFDPTRQVFTNLQHGTTDLGDELAWKQVGA